MRFNQIVILPACDFNIKKDKTYFLSFFKKYKFRRPKIIDVITTIPNKDENGNIIIGTGGRKDLFFYINEKDETRFRIWKFVYGMIYWEDCDKDIYPISFINKIKGDVNGKGKKNL